MKRQVKIVNNILLIVELFNRPYDKGWKLVDESKFGGDYSIEEVENYGDHGGGDLRIIAFYCCTGEDRIFKEQNSPYEIYELCEIIDIINNEENYKNL